MILRYRFVVNQLSCDNEVEYGRKNGDFRVNGRYILEVGGRELMFYRYAIILFASFFLHDS